MRRYSFFGVLFVVISWGQTTSRTTGDGARGTAIPAAVTAGPGLSGRNLDSNESKAVITIYGLCDDSSGGKTGSSCKTVITQKEFEDLIDAIQPTMPARTRRDFALRYADALVMTKKAEEMGLDRGERYEERMRVARIDVLSKEVKAVIQERASQISEKDIEDYYRHNTARFEKAQMDRVYIPKAAHTLQASRESDQTTEAEAANLRARAIAGEGFASLQEDAYRTAGIKDHAPPTSIEVRRISLPPNQALAMDLKPGEVSPVFADGSGYVFYRMKAKDTPALDHVREEIRALLSSQRMQDEMRRIQDSASSVLDEHYFHPDQSPASAKPAEPHIKSEAVPGR
jgi:hypothetical protein